MTLLDIAEARNKWVRVTGKMPTHLFVPASRREEFEQMVADFAATSHSIGRVDTLMGMKVNSSPFKGGELDFA